MGRYSASYSDDSTYTEEGSEGLDGERRYYSQGRELPWPKEVEQFTNETFGGWGAYVARNPCKVFWLSFLFCFVCCSGMAKVGDAKFEDEQSVWSPAGNPSILANKR